MLHDRMTVLNAVIDQGVIPVFHHDDVEVCRNVVEACARAGAKCFEFTNRAAFAVDTFAALSRHFAKADPSVILGAGSVVEAPTAALYIASGAGFIVSPALNPELAKLCNRRKTAYMPGCATVTEISEAEELGCEIVKVFPGSCVGGPEFVKSVLGPCPWTRIMPTGGVEPTEASLKGWFDAGVSAVGMSSKLITKARLDARDYAGVESDVRAALALARQVRGRAG